MTEKSEQIKELTHDKDELENYFRNTIIPQLYVDGNLKLRKFTPPAMKQFNLSKSDLGKSIVDIKDNLRFMTIEENIQDVLESSEILEKEIQTTDMRWYQMNIIPYVKMEDNKTDGVIITFVEITRRINDLKIQEKLIADNALLLDTIFHDIRNPLANLVLAVELFKDTSPDDEQDFTGLLGIVDSALHKMHKVIEELTEVRKQEYENDSEEELLSIEHILEDVRITLSDDFRKAKAHISRKIEVSEIKFSRRKLRTVLYNLVNNAIKFRSPDRAPEIVVSSYMENNHVVLSIKDNGKGIADEDIDSIFQKYSRFDKEVEGTGVGLYLVNEIVSAAGGKIEVDSVLGEGSEFRIYLKPE